MYNDRIKILKLAAKFYQGEKKSYVHIKQDTICIELGGGSYDYAGKLKLRPSTAKEITLLSTKNYPLLTQSTHMT
jgi:hypothetical protein